MLELAKWHHFSCLLRVGKLLLSHVKKKASKEGKKERGGERRKAR